MGHLFTLPKEWPVPDSISNKIKQAVEDGHVEFFSINGTDFRFQKNSRTTNLYNIEIKQKNKWVTNLTLPMPKETFFLTHDFDLDNYFDLSFLEYGHINVYFFDKTTRHFLPAPVQFSNDYALLDSNNLIYGANNHNSRDWDIDIFSIKHRSKTYLYKAKLFLKDNTNNGGFEITKALLYKCRHGKESDTILLNDIDIHRQFGDFSLVEFMKDIAHNKVYR